MMKLKKLLIAVAHQPTNWQENKEKAALSLKHYINKQGQVWSQLKWKITYVCNAEHRNAQLCKYLRPGLQRAAQLRS